ncbi:hypothetical protein SCUCBS95973_004785 [Sporothrix curviconia]|uniref:Uncharacterized protein n=1 Tax=Sporothrix curviconia TaxID=1260050 RepID=A0ABP0BRC4_9PEZI
MDTSTTIIMGMSKAHAYAYNHGPSYNPGHSYHHGHNYNHGPSYNHGHSYNQGPSYHHGHNYNHGPSYNHGHSYHQGHSYNQGHAYNHGLAYNQGHSYNQPQPHAYGYNQGHSYYQGQFQNPRNRQQYHSHGQRLPAHSSHGVRFSSRPTRRTTTEPPAALPGPATVPAPASTIASTHTRASTPRARHPLPYGWMAPYAHLSRRGRRALIQQWVQSPRRAPEAPGPATNANWNPRAKL